MFSSVVLPAPLGPITETRSPRVTSRLTRLTACTPPNDLETSRISRSALIGSQTRLDFRSVASPAATAPETGCGSYGHADYESQPLRPGQCVPAREILRCPP